jgi:hypothetical protein
MQKKRGARWIIRPLSFLFTISKIRGRETTKHAKITKHAKKAMPIGLLLEVIVVQSKKINP